MRIGDYIIDTEWVDKIQNPTINYNSHDYFYAKKLTHYNDQNFCYIFIWKSSKSDNDPVLIEFPIIALDECHAKMYNKDLDFVCFDNVSDAMNHVDSFLDKLSKLKAFL